METFQLRLSCITNQADQLMTLPSSARGIVYHIPKRSNRHLRRWVSLLQISVVQLHSRGATALSLYFT